MGVVVVLAGQIGVVIASFIGIASVVGWYHGEGGKGNGKPHGGQIPGKNPR